MSSSHKQCILLPAVLIALVACRRHDHPLPPPQTQMTAASGTVSFTVRQHENMSTLLARAGISSTTTARVIAALDTAGFNFQAMRSGESLAVSRLESIPLRIHYYQGPERIWRVDIDKPGYSVSMLWPKVTSEIRLVAGDIDGSLYQSLLAAGESPALVARYADIFGWEIDFFSDPQPGDSFLLLFEKRFINGCFADYGTIWAARYRGQVGDFSAFRFTDPEGHTDYYNYAGQSLRRTFLRSPLSFSRISSRFGIRRHPILRVRRMHHGLDYLAPTGTPVSCVANGRVTTAAWTGGYGRLVEVSHSGGYTTRYGHLSRFGSGIRPGATVIQGQVIGYVGTSGLSTGPHLHYEVRQQGRVINPRQLNPPRAEPVKPAYSTRFQAVRDSLLPLLSVHEWAETPLQPPPGRALRPPRR